MGLARYWQQHHICVCFVPCGGRAAVRTLPLRCVLPMATHLETDGTLMIIMGGANCRIAHGPHTQLFGVARHSFFIFFICFYKLVPCYMLFLFTRGSCRCYLQDDPS